MHQREWDLICFLVFVLPSLGLMSGPIQKEISKIDGLTARLSRQLEARFKCDLRQIAPVNQVPRKLALEPFILLVHSPLPIHWKLVVRWPDERFPIISLTHRQHLMRRHAMSSSLMTDTWDQLSFVSMVTNLPFNFEGEILRFGVFSK